jgi:hypothetical protein
MVIANYMPTPAKDFFANLCLKFNYTRAQCACLAIYQHTLRLVVYTLVAGKSALSFVSTETLEQKAAPESKTRHTCVHWVMTQ